MNSRVRAQIGYIPTMTTARLRDAAAPPRDIRAGGAEDGVSFRERLIQGLATSIRERGFRDTTIADVVRHARTSRRTFYVEFVSKEECYVALLDALNEALRVQIAADRKSVV